jgi:hypothetical protein
MRGARAFDSRRIATYAIAVVVILIMCGMGGLVVHRSLESSRAPTQALWSKIATGDSESRIRELLGEPRHEYTKDNAPEDYYVKGYGRKERPITERVLIYMGKVDLILYVYFDPQGRVEETVIAGS